jgi:hypothetical protein
MSSIEDINSSIGNVETEEPNNNNVANIIAGIEKALISKTSKKSKKSSVIQMQNSSKGNDHNNGTYCDPKELDNGNNNDNNELDMKQCEREQGTIGTFYEILSSIIPTNNEDESQMILDASDIYVPITTDDNSNDTNIEINVTRKKGTIQDLSSISSSKSSLKKVKINFDNKDCHDNELKADVNSDIKIMTNKLSSMSDKLHSKYCSLLEKHLLNVDNIQDSYKNLKTDKLEVNDFDSMYSNLLNKHLTKVATIDINTVLVKLNRI